MRCVVEVVIIKVRKETTEEGRGKIRLQLIQEKGNEEKRERTGERGRVK